MAQSGLIDQLAAQVCNCMETADLSVPAEERARDCVRVVGERRKKMLLREFSLDPGRPEDIDLLSERLADQMSVDCPLLTTLRLDKVERELRWSDKNTFRSSPSRAFRYKFPKPPPADPPLGSVSEPPLVWRLSGTVTDRTGRGRLVLRTTDGTTQILEFPATIRRRVKLLPGQTVTVTFERQWRNTAEAGTIAWVVRAVE